MREAAASGDASSAQADIGSVPRLTSVDDLDRWDVPDRVRVLIVQGRHPDEVKERDDSRSAWLFEVVCTLVRKNVPDNVIYSVITDPEFAISASVLDKGSPANCHRYAVRQIEQGKEKCARSLEAPALLSPSTPRASARAFLERESPYLKRYKSEWVRYDGAAYLGLEDDTVAAEMADFLEKSKEQTRNGDIIDFRLNSARLADAVRMLATIAHVPHDRYDPPCWLEGAGPPAVDIVAFQNGLLHLPSGNLLEPTPKFFTRNALPFDYDPEAAPPGNWLAFLESIWGDDEAAIESLREIFGYLLAPDTSLQKAFLLLGPPRSGKGTIGRVLTKLVGDRNTCAPTLSQLTENFGMQGLVGKQLAVISDARLGSRADKEAVSENLLRVTGEDSVTVDIKYRPPWTGRLTTRFLVMANKPPPFIDASGALASRFVLLKMQRSFLDQEDPKLESRLLEELPGILNWAIKGWHSLRARGHFLIPPSAEEAFKQLAETASPVSTFVEECCLLEPEMRVEKDVLFGAWQSWCGRNGHRPGTSNTFGRDLLAAFERRGVCSARPRKGGGRVSVYVGIGLRWAEEPDDVM